MAAKSLIKATATLAVTTLVRATGGGVTGETNVPMVQAGSIDHQSREAIALGIFD